jgi:uncharacterized protein
VELTNCGTSAIDLSLYAIQIFNNGSTGSSSSQTLTGTLPAGQSHVVSYENSDSVGSSTFRTVYGFDADELRPGANINGDDTVVLVLLSSGATVDAYGVVGEDGTGKVWDYEDSYSVRKTGVVAPSATFTASEWTFAGANVLDNDTAQEIASQTSPKSHVCQTGVVGDPSARPSSRPSTSAKPSRSPVMLPPPTTIMTIQGR